MTSSSPTSKPKSKTSAPDSAPSNRLQFQPLSGPLRKGAFCCGVGEIDRWFEKAHKRHSRLEARITTAHFAGNSTPVAFYALCSALEHDGALSTSGVQSYFSKAGHFSCVQIPYIGVQQQLQGNGIGRHLMIAAIRDFAQVALLTGVCALTLVALDERRAAFYATLGFKEYDREHGRPKMLMPAQTAIDLYQGQG